MNTVENSSHKEPVFVGAFPGSGTRVISRILSRSGIFMGSRINNTNDSIFFADFLNSWARPYLDAEFSANDSGHGRMREAFKLSLQQHLLDVPPGAKWGSKNPRNILIMPFLHSLFPAMKFIHVLRDGRDLAASPKPRIKIKQYAPALIGKEVQTAGDLVELWSAMTLMGWEFGERLLGSNYLLVRFEDLCLEPRRTIVRLMEFINVPAGDLDRIVAEIRPPHNAIGRWENARSEFDSLPDSAKNTLQKFGYI